MRTLVMTALAVSLTLSMWGCEEESTEDVGEETAEVATPPESAAEPAEAEAPVEEEAPVEPGADEAAEMAQAVEEAVDEAAAAQPASAAGGEGNCEQAYDEISGMIAAMQKQMGKGPGQENMPSKAQFVSGCQSLPENVQQCMRLSYGMQHQQECQQALNSLSPEQKSRAQELMGR